MVPVKPQVFLSMEQFPVRGLTLLLIPERDRGSAIAALRSTLGEIDADMPLARISALDDDYAVVTQLPRYFATIVGTFAAAALLLSVIGVYGVMAYSVSQRRQELGVRMALGARPERMLTLILGEGARLAVIGLAAGIVLAALSTRLLQASLYGVGKLDLSTFLIVSMILAASTLLASWIPARRAGALNPVVALRQD
jgi:putative ABC transport system permease protein